MKVLSILMVLIVFQSNAQIDLLNDTVVRLKGIVFPETTIVPTSVEYSSRNPQIISNMLLVGESNKLLVAYDPLDTQASSPFDVIGGEVD